MFKLVVTHYFSHASVAVLYFNDTKVLYCYYSNLHNFNKCIYDK